MHRSFLARTIFACCIVARSATISVGAAEATTGTLVGTVDSKNGPVAGARATIVAPSGVYVATSDARGHFRVLGITPDTYALKVVASGFYDASQPGVTILPGQTQFVVLHLVAVLTTIASVQSKNKSFTTGSTSDTFTVSGAQARAISPPVSSSGLATYIAGTVQGAIASVPGVVLDPFANAILRGGKVSDATFDYDSVPIPQGLVAEPGGNIVGAQLPTTGVAYTTTTLAGYTNQGENSLGGVIDEIPAVGTYPGSVTLESGVGIGAQFQQTSLQVLGATPDLKWRYAFATMTGSQYFLYGNGSFYPEEAATYGLALQNRGEYSVESNVHYRIDSNDDVSILGLAGQATYNQYGSPYAGETVGAFDPTQPNPDAPVNYASGIRGSYSILKAQWLHSGAHWLSRVQLYQSQYGSQAGGPFWDETVGPTGSSRSPRRKQAERRGWATTVRTSSASITIFVSEPSTARIRRGSTRSYRRPGSSSLQIRRYSRIWRIWATPGTLRRGSTLWRQRVSPIRTSSRAMGASTTMAPSIRTFPPRTSSPTPSRRASPTIATRLPRFRSKWIASIRPTSIR